MEACQIHDELVLTKTAFLYGVCGSAARSADARLASDSVDEDPMDQRLDHSMTYGISVGPQQGRKVFTMQTIDGDTN